MILIKGGTVFGSQGLRIADVLVRGQTISSVAPDLTTDGAVEIDATDCLVGPGFVDLHVHLREPGQTWKEDIGTGAAAAAAGGFTAVVAMPNTDPPIDDVKVVEEILARAETVGLVDVAVAGALTQGRQGAAPSELERLYEAGVRIFTDDGDSVGDSDLLRRIMERIAVLKGAVVAQHAEEASMTIGGHMHQGRVSGRLGVGGMPAAAEELVVERDLDLVAETGARYHCQHVSSAGTLALLQDAKNAGLPVTAEVTPHHLSFCEDDLESRDPNFKMYPPLRSARDRHELRHALRDGLIDIVATDHAPHAVDEKKTSFEDAPRGVIGLETAAPVVWSTVADPESLFRTLSVRPAAIGGMAMHGLPVEAGNPANLVVFDPEAEWVPREFESKASNSPYLGTKLRGRVCATIHNGRITHELGERW